MVKRMSDKIRPKGILLPSKAGTTHLPKEIRDELGNQKKIAYVLDARTAILFNPDTPPEKVLKSLDILRQDIMMRIEKVDKK